MILIGFIGYKNHSLKILKILDAIKINKKIIIFHPSKNIKITNININTDFVIVNDIKILHKCDCIFITSPNETHADYIKKFYKKTYVFCEKPPLVNLREYFFLKNIPTKYKKKILFNFHLLNTKMFSEILNILKNKNNGILQNISISVSHGGMLSKKLRNKRFQNYDNFSNIFGNLGIHYLRLIIELSSRIKIISVSLKSFNQKKVIDTANVCIEGDNKVNYSIFLSYSSPLTNFIKIAFTNLIMVFDDGFLYLQKPRNTFDKEGNFSKSKKLVIFKYKNAIKHNSEGIKNRIEYFLNAVSQKSFFKIDDFNKSIVTAKSIIDFLNKK